jgi:hypothetical protein
LQQYLPLTVVGRSSLDHLVLPGNEKSQRQGVSNLQALRLQIVSKKVNHVFEADIRSYFIRISHQRPQGAYCSASRL